MSASVVIISPFSPFTKYPPMISFLSFRSCFAIANIFLRPSAVFKFSYHSSNDICFAIATNLLSSFFLALYIISSSDVRLRCHALYATFFNLITSLTSSHHHHVSLSLPLLPLVSPHVTLQASTMDIRVSCQLFPISWKFSSNFRSKLLSYLVILQLPRFQLSSSSDSPPLHMTHSKVCSNRSMLCYTELLLCNLLVLCLSLVSSKLIQLSLCPSTDICHCFILVLFEECVQYPKVLVLTKLQYCFSFPIYSTVTI